MRCHAIWLLAPVVPIVIAAAPWAGTAQRIRDEHQRQPASLQQQARQALHDRVVQANFSNVALFDLIDRIRDRTNLNINVNWKALEPLGVTRQTAITVRLHGISVKQLLQTILDQAGGPDHLTFYLDQGVLEITTQQFADQQLVTRVYPVGDLLMDVPNFAGPHVELSSIGQSAGGRSGGGNASLFSDNSSDQSTTTEQPKSKQQRADDLVTVIKQTIRPQIWRDNGGVASIACFNGYLVVTAPRSVQAALGGDEN